MDTSGTFYTFCFLEALFLVFGIFCCKKKQESWYTVWSWLLIPLQCCLLGISLLEWNTVATKMSLMYVGMFLFNFAVVAVILKYAKLMPKTSSEEDLQQQSQPVVVTISDGLLEMPANYTQIRFSANSATQHQRSRNSNDLPPSYSECCGVSKSDEAPPPKYSSITFH